MASAVETWPTCAPLTDMDVFKRALILHKEKRIKPENSFVTLHRRNLSRMAPLFTHRNKLLNMMTVPACSCTLAKLHVHQCQEQSCKLH